MRKPVIVPIFFLIAGSILCVAGVGLFCHMALARHPRKSTAPRGAETVTARAPDGELLSAWWMRATAQNGNCVAVLHGIADSRASAVGFGPMFLSEGYSVLVPDSRAHGESGGEFVTYGLLEKYDVIAWADWMKRAGCRKLFGLGESLGASVLIESAGVRPVFTAIVAECPYADLREVAAYRVQQIGHVPAFLARLIVKSAMVYARRVDGLDLGHVSPVESMARTATPILLIHGLLDTRTPPYNSERLAGVNPRASLWLVPNADHTGASTAQPNEFRKRVLGWFAEH